MANDLNDCKFIGRLGGDPESRFMPNGEAVCSFRIAVGSQWNDKSGDRKESTEWVSITAFSKLGEICGQYLKKGSQVFISGRMKTDEYEKDGVKRYSTKIIADKMQMLGGKPEGSSSAPSQNSAPSASKPSGGASSNGDFDEIPF